jgi:hypothetical protein
MKLAITDVMAVLGLGQFLDKVNVPGDPVTTNQLLLAHLRTLYVIAASLGASINSTPRQAQVQAGASATLLMDVVEGEEWVLIVSNWDRDNANPVYCDTTPNVLPSQIGPTGIIPGVGTPVNGGEKHLFVIDRPFYGILDTWVAAPAYVPVHIEAMRLISRAPQAEVNLGVGEPLKGGVSPVSGFFNNVFNTAPVRIEGGRR